MKKILLILMFFVVASFGYDQTLSTKSNADNIEISFIGSAGASSFQPNHAVASMLDIAIESSVEAATPLGFDCDFLNNDIILKIGDFEYVYDINQTECVRVGNKNTLTWLATNAKYGAKEYTIHVIEKDTFKDDEYDGKNIVFTEEEIKALKAGIYIQKDIGADYFIGFQKR